jgi:hypothetical protein
MWMTVAIQILPAISRADVAGSLFLQGIYRDGAKFLNEIKGRTRKIGQ